MPYMPGCSLKKMCDNNTTLASQNACMPLSVLGSVCKADMPNMNSCENYRALCGNASSAVKQCTDEAPPRNFPLTDTVNTLVLGICTEMAMDGCSDCKLNNGEKYARCDLLATYGKLCQAMPDMALCGAWKSMCDAEMSQFVTLCGGAGGSGESSSPVMRMYFHQALQEYFLFKEWVPQTTAQYVGSLLSIFLLGILFEFISAARTVSESLWKKEYGGRQPSSLRGFLRGPFIVSIELKRAAYCAVEITLAYCLMLLAMTFNGGIFTVVVLGIATGRFLFGRVQAEQPGQAATCH
jgi:copper transporter 1